ncbi:MAG: membrane dipeptidase [Anaerolineae bacterium]|nr:membrane dipeptidase [Anaerolineae bacterium]
MTNNDSHTNHALNVGVVDMHYDLMMDLYQKRDRKGVLVDDYLADFTTGGIGVVAAAIYLEDKYLPEMGLRVALDQIALLYDEVARSSHFAICRTYAEIEAARQAGKIALLITMEGIEPLGSDIHLLRVFYELGLRVVGLTHVRRNAAGDGGVFAPDGSSPQGLTRFGRELIAACEALGIIIDLAHINPAGFNDILAATTKPVIVSHSNARHFYDIERNISDEQIRLIGQRGGVIGVNATLVSPTAADSHMDRYVDHIDYIAELIGIDGVGIGFDFFETIHYAMSREDQEKLAAALTTVYFVPELTNHAHAPNVTAKLTERGFSADDIAKIMYGNWMRIFRQML